MSVPADQVAELVAVCEDARVMPEGVYPFVFLHNLKIRVGDQAHIVDALLCPTTHSGYTTRLFLSAPIPSRGANWTQHNILSRVWHACSWQGVTADLRLIDILANHLGAFR